MDGTRTELEDGAVIFEEGADSDQAFIIEEGHVQIVKAIGGVPRQLAVLDTGELFGEMGVIDGSPRSARAIASGPCVLTTIRGDHFLRRINKDPSFAASVMGKLVERLRHTTALVDLQPAEGAAGHQRKGPEKFDGDTWEDAPELPLPDPTANSESREKTAAPDKGPVEPKGLDETRPGKSQPDAEPKGVSTTEKAAPVSPERTDDTTSGLSGPQRTLPSSLSTATSAEQGKAATQKTVSDEHALTKSQSGIKPLRFLLPLPVSAQEDGDATCLSERLQAILPIDPIRQDVLRDTSGLETITAPLGGQFDQIRFAAMKARVTLSVLDRDDGKLQRIRFLSPWPDDEARLGGFSALDELILPKDSSDRFQNELLASALIAASQTMDDDKLRIFRRILPPDFTSARQQGSLLLQGLSGDDLGRQYTVLGCVFSRAAVISGSNARFRDALNAFEAAHAALRDDGSDSIRGIALLHLAILLSTMADRMKDANHRNRATQCCTEAAECFDPKDTPYQFVTAWARLGALHYRAAIENGDIESCKSGLQAFRTALKACDRQKMAEPWADVMNGLGQLLILMGKLAKNTEFITWAVQVCTNATEVRSKSANPTGWARTANNLGTALYLLAKANTDDAGFETSIDMFEAAEDIFAHHKISGMAETCKRNRLLVENYRDQLGGSGSAPIDWWEEETDPR